MNCYPCIGREPFGLERDGPFMPWHRPNRTVADPVTDQPRPGIRIAFLGFRGPG